jgi:DNA repair protein RecO (recombination protein O)
MSELTSEAIVLRTWPVQEADLIVSFFTRDYGRVKGVAKAALKSRKRFGGALEPMTVARAWFAERPRQELVRLDQLEIVRSPLSRPVDHARMAALSLYAEVLDESLPEHDPQETIFRLVLSVLEQTTVAESETVQPWMPLTYFLLWMTRLMGLLPDIGHCTACGEPLHGAAALGAGGDLRGGDPEQPPEAWFHSFSDGLFCAVHRGGSANQLTPDSWQIAQRMLRAPVAAFAAEAWPRRRGEDLRRFTVQSLERHLERKLKSAEVLARMSGIGATRGVQAEG